MFEVYKRYEVSFTSYIIYVLGIYKYFHLGWRISELVI